MPFKSKKQKKLFDIVAADKEFANKVGIKQSVAKKMIKDDRLAKDKQKQK